MAYQSEFKVIPEKGHNLTSKHLKEVSESSSFITPGFLFGWFVFVYLFGLPFSTICILDLIGPLIDKLDNTSEVTQCVVILMWSIVLPISLPFIINRFVKKRAVDALIRQATGRQFAEANELTSKAIHLLESSIELSISLPKQLRKASESLKQAQSEYNANAFDPFWDKVEEAAYYLATFSSSVREIGQNAINYSDSLKSRNHNFPSFPVKHESFPESLTIAREFDRVVRMGQTNFQFATILGHRKTREVLIAGFRNFGDAVNNLGMWVENSIADFNDSLSSEISRLYEEEIKTRKIIEKRSKEQVKKLEDIQRRRH